jgi:hypothetical protein
MKIIRLSMLQRYKSVNGKKKQEILNYIFLINIFGLSGDLGRCQANCDLLSLRWINLYSWRKKKDDHFVFRLFCPQAGLALPFPIDEKEAKILSKRTLRRAF